MADVDRLSSSGNSLMAHNGQQQPDSPQNVPTSPQLNDSHHHHAGSNPSTPLSGGETPTSPGLPMSPGFTPGMPVLSPGPLDPVHHLPPDLLAAGWRRFWSKREGRWYFFNKVNNESRWEMPGVSLEVDPFTDPLGIQQNTPTPTPQTPTIQPPLQIPEKRRLSDECQGGPAMKKVAVDLTFSPYWNFEAPSNVTTLVRKPCIQPPPVPEIELLRATYVSKLRNYYQELCRTRESIKAPDGSFNRWLMERKVSEGQAATCTDPILPSQCVCEVSPAMYRELMNDIPVRLVNVKYSRDAHRQLFKYAEAAKRMIESRSTSAESRKIVKWSADDTFAWLRKPGSPTYEDYLERLAHLRRQCQPHVAEAARSSLEGICTKLYTMAQEASSKLIEKHWQLLKEANIFSSPKNIQEPSRRKVLCYPIQLAAVSPRMPSVDRIIEESMVTLKFQSESLEISAAHFHKLEQLYKLSCHDDPRFDLFLGRAWCLLRRYRTYFGLQPSEGQEFHGALPLPVFECINRVFGVSFECFASPLNCYFKQYCSAFADTDGFFGSRGPVLDFFPQSGSFEANPPFCEELMEAMVDHFESLLGETEEPLSFMVFIPDWRDPPTEALIRLEQSAFTKKVLSVPAHEHEYRHGFQHVCKDDDMNQKASHGTLIVFLQNEAGFRQWGPTPERIRELLLAYRPKDSVKPVHD